MTGLPPRERVRDAALMRALAHPLRAALLDYLGAVGPRTASECGEAVVSSASNCSWHLRQLASFGLVERVDAEDGRERPWRAKHVGLELEDKLDPAALGMAAAMLGQDQELTQRFLDTREQLEPAWQAAAGFNFYALRVTPSELTELVEQIDKLLRPFVAPIRQNAPEDARPVHVGLRAVPRVEADGKPSR